MTEIETGGGQDEEENKERQLSPEELKKNHEAIKSFEKLTSTNPQAPKVLVNYNYISREFQKADHVEQYIMHFSIDGDTIQRESEEYKIQEEILETRSRNLKGTIKLHDLASASGDSDRNELKKARRIMRNKFNYSERDTQTPKVIIETKLARTAKPELVNWCSTVNQSMIYDLYLKDKLDKEKTNKDSYKDNSKEGSRGLHKILRVQYSWIDYWLSIRGLYAANLPRCLKIMERMIVQNEQQQIYREYKYMFSDKDTEVTKKSHTWVALWNFNFANTSKKNVTSICWNPKYSDMFVIGYGIYAFGKKKSVGYICICSLKNNKNSEMVLQTDGDVMSLDFHPTQPALLAVGLYDGVVLVFDIRNKTNRQPIYQSSIKTKKHTDPVWQVKWNANPTSADVHNFYSISSDGRVMNWILMKDKLEPEEVIRLKLVNNPIKSKMKNKQNDEETSLISLACGLCFDFNNFDQFSFIVGTEEGNIHKCSKAYSGQYQKTYEGHQLAVYKVRWNPFHPRTFISASADWTIKIWDADIDTPVMSFDLNNPMVDVVWSPFNSYVFIALSLIKAHVYNLKVDRHTRAADVKPVNSGKLTNLAFNPRDPIFLIGDDKSNVGVFKLSQDLAKPPAETKPGEPRFKKEDLDLELKEMEELLHVGNFDRDDDTTQL